MSFFVDKIMPEGLTLNHIQLKPYYSEYLLRQHGFISSFAHGIRINTPLVITAGVIESANYNSR